MGQIESENPIIATKIETSTTPLPKKHISESLALKRNVSLSFISPHLQKTMYVSEETHIINIAEAWVKLNPKTQLSPRRLKHSPTHFRRSTLACISHFKEMKCHHLPFLPSCNKIICGPEGTHITTLQGYESN
jgi:hypothetical protein